MSTLAESRKFDYNYSGSILTEKDINDSFRYIRPNQFNNIVKEVERQRSKRDEEHLWTSVLQHQDLKFKKNTHEYGTVSNYDLMKLELKNLEENTHSFGSKTRRINKKYEEPFEIKEQAFTKRQLESLNSTKRSSSSNSSSETFIVTQDNNNFVDSPKNNSIGKSHISSVTLNDNFNYQKNKNYCNSSPELNLQYEKVTKDRKIYEISLHPNVIKKVLIIQTKISELLNEISYRLGRIPRPDGESDLRRRQQRLAEFGIRFSRNYLYVLGRQVIDIQQHIKAAELTSKEKIKKNNFILHVQAIESKILSSHQLLMYALDAYAKHISSSGIKGHPDIYPLGDNIQTRCYEILSKVNSTSEINSPSAISYGAHSTHGFPGVSDKRKIDNHKIPNRLSMYNSVSNKKSYRDPKNRRHVTVGIHPKDRAQRTLSMPINNPPPTPDQSYQNSLIRKSQKIRKSRINGLLHEDKISTTMGLIPKFSETIISSERLSRKLPSTAPSEIKIKKKPKCCYKKSKLSLQSDETVLHDKKSKIKQEDLSNFIPVIADFMALLPKNKNNNETEFWASFEEHQEQCKKPKIKMTNSNDNAKLICVNYEEEKTDDKNEDETKLIVDEKVAERILNYREKFYQFCLTNSMYTSKTSNEPSEVVAWVSEKLKEELLVDLTKKLEMNEVIRRLFDLEFQEF
ncbi:uncharacterized protein LOC122855229 isoform X2 [Aphidius gifuensis]|uniref:uncharacterized protein LOC122855229 isoform X2 n=1 Tax=Aphidius gifuensis TaxID=684658 RepID=UPI001CDD69CE|nr:uncharacterized protein LOC122855229 isoform X2 [Aphidius gifuensis]